MVIAIKCSFKNWKWISREFGRIHLVDRCLITFMAVLLIQSAYSLIAQGAWAAQSNEIDVIVRTSTASIFGYFLSANFIRRGSEKPDLGGESLEPEQLEQEPDYESGHFVGSGKLQILIATGIGLFCMVTLILLRNVGGGEPAGYSATTAATITQFRDFVSGCVGFLIGCPTTDGNNGGS